MDQPRSSTRFRKQLKDHLRLWRDEGLVTGEQAETISVRYSLNSLGDESTSRLLLLVYTIGAMLIGAGVISFVAAHWDAIGRTPKVTMLVTAMLAAHGGGYYLWQIRGSHTRLGHTLVLLGCLIFGANIGLFAQIFHISSNPYNGLAAWAIGTIVVAYAVRSVPNAILALIVSFIYWVSWCDHNAQEHEWAIYPYLAAAVFLPFAFRERSRLLLMLAIIAITISGIWASSLDNSGTMVLPMTTLLFGVMWLLAGLACRGTEFSYLAPILMSTGTLLASGMLYVYSFLEAGRDAIREADLARLSPADGMVPLVTVIASLVLWPLAVKRSLGRMVFVVLAAVATASAFTWIGAAMVLANEFVVSMAANICFFALAVTLLWASFICQDRRLFWSGSIMVGLLVIGRFLEYETELMLKAAVFVGCGIALIIAGVMFEKYLRSRRPASE
jgi:uncharacterized membrane protein